MDWSTMGILSNSILSQPSNIIQVQLLSFLLSTKLFMARPSIMEPSTFLTNMVAIRYQNRVMDNRLCSKITEHNRTYILFDFIFMYLNTRVVQK